MDLILPAWTAPPQVGAAFSTRRGGVSAPPFDSLNLHLPMSSGPVSGSPSDGAAGDDPDAVLANRAAYAQALQAQPRYLRQVHGVRVVELQAAGPRDDAVEADAAWTREPGLACTVLVADCLPVLLCNGQGTAVAAVHAGWRGLAGGVLEATVQALGDATGSRPAGLMAWLGPCIGPSAFEVGADVLTAFGVPGLPGVESARFAWSPRPDGTARWRADLSGLARDRLHRQGVTAVWGGDGCTVSDPSRFFSFRRDGRTGRMAASVWLRRR